jgi:hypothetical protein
MKIYIGTRKTFSNEQVMVMYTTSTSCTFHNWIKEPIAKKQQNIKYVPILYLQSHLFMMLWFNQ